MFVFQHVQPARIFRQINTVFGLIASTDLRIVATNAFERVSDGLAFVWCLNA